MPSIAILRAITTLLPFVGINVHIPLPFFFQALLLEPTASSEKEDVTEPGVVREWWAWLISLAPCVYIQEHRGIRE
jgi:hypothetical protein